jgi:integrase
LPRPRKPPSYLHHKPTGQARVRINGRDYYLGAYGSPESQEAYREFLRKHAATNGTAVSPDMTVDELAAAYVQHARNYYRKNGRETSEVHCVRCAIAALLATHSRKPARTFGPLALEMCRQWMIGRQLARSTINKHVHRIRRIFKWGASKELLSLSIYNELLSVSALSRGRRPDVREPLPKTPANEVSVKAVSKLFPRMRDMFELQRLSGMRPGEICALRVRDVAKPKKSKCWVYIPGDHKTIHRGKARVILFGPKAQQILARRMQGLGTDDFIFQTIRGCRFTVNRYRQLVAKACKKLGVPHCHPHQLRHTGASNVAAIFDEDAARTVLGHGSISTTRLYITPDLRRAMDVMAKIG